MTVRTELTPVSDSRQSFYGKAHVTHDGTAMRLYSYGSHVVTVHQETREVALMPLWDSSQTTLRHVKEFLRQLGYTVGTKAQITKLYLENN